MTLKGLDISKYQGNPDFDQVKAAGNQFVICKVSEGFGYVDPNFSRTQSEMRRTGLLLGYYHFARPDLGNKPEREADFFLNTIGEIRDGELLTLDFEVTFSDAVNWCHNFLNEVFTRTGCKPLIYLNQSQILSLNWQPVIAGDYGLWVASYDNNPEGLKFTPPWPTVAMKQYTSSGIVAGINGNVDLDSFFGDETTFKAYGYKISSTPTMTDEQKRVFDILTGYRLDRTQGPEGNMEGFVNAIIGSDKAVPGLITQRNDYQNANNIQANQITFLNGEILKLNTQITNLQNQPMGIPVTPEEKSTLKGIWQKFLNWWKT